MLPHVGLPVKSKGKPDAGNPHVRFDEGEGVSPPYSTASAVKKDFIRLNFYLNFWLNLRNPKMDAENIS
jgi:hypothetical protein